MFFIRVKQSISLPVVVRHMQNNHKARKRVLEKRIIPKEDIIKNDTFFLPNEKGTPEQSNSQFVLGKTALTHL